MRRTQNTKVVHGSVEPASLTCLDRVIVAGSGKLFIYFIEVLHSLPSLIFGRIKGGRGVEKEKKLAFPETPSHFIYSISSHFMLFGKFVSNVQARWST